MGGYCCRTLFSLIEPEYVAGSAAAPVEGFHCSYNVVDLRDVGEGVGVFEIYCLFEGDGGIHQHEEEHEEGGRGQRTVVALQQTGDVGEVTAHGGCRSRRVYIKEWREVGEGIVGTPFAPFFVECMQACGVAAIGGGSFAVCHHVGNPTAE